MNILIELQYFPNVYSSSCLIKSTNVDFRLSESWKKQRFRNRTIIATANGLQLLSIPIEGGRSQRALYKDVRIDYRGNWQVRHWRSIFSAYGKSPWFYQYADGLEALFRQRDHFLVDWNLRCLAWVATVLRLPADSPVVQAIHHRDMPPLPAGPAVDFSDPQFQYPRRSAFPRYPQVFEARWGFQPNLSILDLICCCGPGSMEILRSVETGEGS